jgi:hypothetical protein
MIIFELACSADHRFEGWFASAEAFETQESAGLLECPVCGSHDVVKIPHAKIAVPGDAPPAERSRMPATPAQNQTPATPQERFHAVAAFVQRVMSETEDVGPAFPEEARRIHYEEAPKRSIRGIATVDETRELLDEGINVLPLPVPVKKDWN